MSFPITGVTNMIRKALNTLDYRLMDHGERVAYLVLCMMKQENKHTDRQLVEYCYISMLHDIGAFKTEMIDSLVNVNQLFKFELKSSLLHSIYSYLFLRDFCFLNDSVDAVLYHHFTYPQLISSDCKSKELAAKIFTADRIDIMIIKGLAASAEDVFERLDNEVFCKENVQLLKELQNEQEIFTKLFDKSFATELHQFIESVELSDEENASLVTMLPYTIDFRSEATVTHTVATVEVACALAELLELCEQDRTNIYYGALLHDIGKISTSLLILEKTDKLTDIEYGIMKDHVLLSEYILKGRVNTEILNIAVRHHEKLDGSGYPYGLKAEDLSLNERIVAVADIMSALIGRRSYKNPFPKEKVIAIIEDMAANNKICKRVVRAVVENYDMIAQRAEKSGNKALERYKTLSSELDRLYQMLA